MLQPCKVVLEKYDHKSNHAPYPLTRKLSIRIKNRSLKTGKIIEKTQGDKLDTDDIVKLSSPIKKKKIILKRDGERIIAVVFNKDPTDDDFTAVLEYLIQKHKEKKKNIWEVSTSEPKKDPIVDKVPLVDQDPIVEQELVVNQDPIVDQNPIVEQDLLKNLNNSYVEDIDFTIISSKSDGDNSSKISSGLENTGLKIEQTATKFEEGNSGLLFCEPL